MRTFLTLFVAAGCVTLFADSPAPATFTESGHTTDSLKVVKSRISDESAVLIDVREPTEWDAGHLKAAKLVPMSAVRAEELTNEMQQCLVKDKIIYCHCRSGGRVLVVTKLLRAQGYDVRPLQAGYEKLLEAGFEQAPEPK